MAHQATVILHFSRSDARLSAAVRRLSERGDRAGLPPGYHLCGAVRSASPAWADCVWRRRFFLEQLFASGGGEALALAVEGLISGRHPGVSEPHASAPPASQNLLLKCRHPHRYFAKEMCCVFRAPLTLRKSAKFRTICPPATCPMSSGNAMPDLPLILPRMSWRNIFIWTEAIGRSSMGCVVTTIASVSRSCWDRPDFLAPFPAPMSKSPAL